MLRICNSIIFHFCLSLHLLPFLDLMWQRLFRRSTFQILLVINDYKVWEPKCHNCPLSLIGASIREGHGFPGVLAVLLLSSWSGVLLRFPLQGCHKWMLVRVGHWRALWGRLAAAVTFLDVLGLFGQTVRGPSTTTIATITGYIWEKKLIEINHQK